MNIGNALCNDLGTARAMEKRQDKCSVGRPWTDDLKKATSSGQMRAVQGR